MSKNTPEKSSVTPIETPKVSTQEELNRLQSELEKAQNPEQKKVIRNEMLSIRRSVNRTKQYTQIAGEKLAESKNSLDDISAADLMRLDKELKGKSKQERRGEFLSKSFLYKRTVDDKGDMLEEPSDGKNLKEGDSLYVDFGKNTSAENAIGTGDMLSMDIKVVKITDNQGNIRIGKRSIQGNKVGYYDERGYIPVYNGFSITIPSKIETETYLKESNPEISLSNNQDDEEKAMDAFIEISEKYDSMGGASPWDLERKQEFQKNATELAKLIETKYGIPWQVTYAQATIESGWGQSGYARGQNNYFGIREGKDGFKTFESIEASFEGYGKLISGNNRYQGAFAYKDNPIKFLETILDAGYIDSRVDSKERYLSNASSIIQNYDALAKAKPSALELMGTSTPDTIISMGEKMLGIPYIGGRSDENATDCSGFVSKIMRDSGVATPGFRQTAAGLKRYTNEVSASETKKGDLMFFWGPHMYSKEPTWNHIAIVLEPPQNGMVKILDASGKSNEGKVAIRTVKIEDKHKFGNPTFYT